MSTFGRANATGRSSGKLDAAESKRLKPPPGSSWTWLTRDLLESPAWRGMSIHCRRFIDFLMIDHCSHAGRENGRLQATYDQLARSSISRKRIAAAIQEAVERGLVEVTRRGGLYGAECRRTPSLYRLTWIGTVNPAGRATNEWQRFKPKKISPRPHVGTVRVPLKQREVA